MTSKSNTSSFLILVRIIGTLQTQNKQQGILFSVKQSHWQYIKQIKIQYSNKNKMKTKTIYFSTCLLLCLSIILSSMQMMAIDMTVYFIDSHGNPMAGGLLEYRDGNGFTFVTETSTGVFDITTDRSEIDLRLTYGPQREKVLDVPTSSDYTFQTKLITVELRNADGTLGCNGADVYFNAYGWKPFGTTGDDGLGCCQMELLSAVCTFKLEQPGCDCQKQCIDLDVTQTATFYANTVYLKNSFNVLLAGGTLEYREGGGNPWLPATESSTGVFNFTTTLPEVGLRMTYDDGRQTVTNVPTTAPYTFNTVLVTVELLKPDLTRGYDGGYSEFLGMTGWNTFGTTGDDGTGYVERQMLPVPFTFSMLYNGIIALVNRQDVGANPLVTFNTQNVCVELRDSNGDPVLDGGIVEYNAHGWQPFGTTGDSGPGVVCGDLLVAPQYCELNWRIFYECGRVVKTQNICNDPLVVFQTDLVTVEFYDFSQQLLDGGYVYHFNPCLDLYCFFGVTGDASTGVVTKELLPTWYWFKIEYNNLSDSIYNDVAVNNFVTFYESGLKSSLVDGNAITDIVNYPNPFNGNTTISFGMEENDNVTIEVYDISGRLIDVIYTGYLPKGNHKLNWDARDVEKGIYIVTCKNSTNISHRNMIRM